jgi:hypothetical protein
MTSSTDDDVADTPERWAETLRSAAMIGELLDVAHRQLPADALRQVLIDPNLVVDPRGLRIQNAHIVEELDLKHLVFPHPLHLIDCNVDAAIQLTGAAVKELRIGGSNFNEVNLDGAEITGGVFADEGFTADGGVRAVGARIGGQLRLRGATLRNKNGEALFLDGVQINGSMFADEGFTADGEIRAIGARIGGLLTFRGATLRNENGEALVLDRAEVNGGVFADKGFTADGEIRAAGARIGGLLTFRGATLRNENGEALVLDGVQINRGMFADEGFTADGEVRAVGARIGGSLTLRGATIRNTSGNGINLESSSIVRLILMPSVVDGRVWLYRTVIGDLITGHQPPGPLVATGWEVSDLHGPLREDVTAAMRWLETDPTCNDPTAKTSIQPWHALAAIYERNGDPAGARKLRYRAAKKVTSQSAGMAKIAGWFYDGLVGHGYYPKRAFGWLVVVVLAGRLLVPSRTKTRFRQT